MNKNKIYWLLACTVIALGVGAYFMVSQNKDASLDSFKTQSVAAFNCNSANLGVPVSECEILVQLFNNTNWTNWTQKTNWLNPTKQVKDWYGIKVVNNKVETINLSNNNLIGRIPSNLSNLTALTNLSLNNNNLNGWIPDSLNNLTNLRVLNLKNNSLAWMIPPTLGDLKNLTFLSLRNNKIDALFIPSTLWNLSNIITLDLGNNQIAWSIPSSFWNLTNIRSLYLDTNKLSSTIPPSLGNLRNLNYLHLYDNQLTWPIPSELWMLTAILEMYLNDNQLCNTLPESFMNNGSWNANNTPNYLNIHNNFILDDEASYSVDMREWMKTQWFVNQDNKIPNQNPKMCGLVWSQCGWPFWECASWYCHDYKPAQCVKSDKNEWLNCSQFKVEDKCNKAGTYVQECKREKEKVGVCKEIICGDGIVDPNEQCDWTRQAQCERPNICGAPNTIRACKCYDPSKIGDEVKVELMDGDWLK